MATDKIISSRIQQKHDTEANWEKAINFIPKVGEIIVYDPDDTHVYSRIKIGDGVTSINNLKFNLDGYATEGYVEEFVSQKSEDSVKKYFLIIETVKQNDNYLLDGITFDEIYEKFNIGNVNMVCHVDGTDYIPLLSVTPNKIMFSGIYQTTSVSLDFNTDGVGILTSNSLVNQNRIQNYYTKNETDRKIANLVNSAPETLDTLGELATAFNENKEIVDALNEAIANKADKDDIVQFDGIVIMGGTW